ncbi:MAG: phosphotransferase [Desulfofustis sp.]|jgi:hypothetical protein|nr:phosphotransferase [Desulfofustis sp.]
MIEREVQEAVVARLIDGNLAGSLEELEFQPLFGDGSSRRFIRVFRNQEPCCLAVVPASLQAKDFAEFRASLTIAKHLHSRGVPVPRVLGADTRIGLILFEDLGDSRLYDRLQAGREDSGRIYREVIDVLVHMQLAGVEQFDRGWCSDTEVYDMEVMIERESGYFYQAFWKDTLYGDEVFGLDEEFDRLACLAAEQFELFFMHRDFQSRNLMIKDGRVRVIDFQAARLGPPGYDIASLLIDPYASLGSRIQQELLDYYLERMSEAGVADVEKIKASYPYLAVQRNLQIIGAFSFLSGKKRKVFFKQFIYPSLIMLENRLIDPGFDDFPTLRRTVAEAIRAYRSGLANRFSTSND